MQSAVRPRNQRSAWRSLCHHPLVYRAHGWPLCNGRTETDVAQNKGEDKYPRPNQIPEPL
jgi:hypothetical protein